ncbi:pimeloyl-ACP methyl ester carboxylesterase [Kribbella sp. VKM Ac-2571]|uniref:alpha/beta fold hydrolase n=1 Tax=Kribbella sp. VKM Ac-2571 TaxID=2512222 RepID=UPI00105F67ED|nr:alpha/beta hydrolase [Kribbella sp. VKM Ac-2571]TDO60008.1 pimeloyl-ACP methyl ester carboxylesterase [Kribbella sp. VKM Ac-2571]
MSTVTSADGTAIAFEAYGEGRPLILIDGATAHRAVNPVNGEVGKLLTDSFRTYAYDRRGRGESSDTAPYAIQREIEDIAALIEDAGQAAILFGWSSGSLLALDAAAAGLPVAGLVLFEPPVVVDDVRPPLPSDYVEQLDAFVAEGRRDKAAELFMTAAAMMPAEAIPGMKQSPYWAPVEEIAHTISYDGRIMGTTMSGNPLPADRWADVKVPVLVLYGDQTWPALSAGAQAVAEHLPTATLKAIPGENHGTEAATLAPVLREFADLT